MSEETKYTMPDFDEYIRQGESDTEQVPNKYRTSFGKASPEKISAHCRRACLI